MERFDDIPDEIEDLVARWMQSSIGVGGEETAKLADELYQRLEALLVQQQGNPKPWNLLADYFGMGENRSLELYCYHRALEAAPSSPEARMGIAIIASMLKRPAQEIRPDVAAALEACTGRPEEEYVLIDACSFSEDPEFNDLVEQARTLGKRFFPDEDWT